MTQPNTPNEIEAIDEIVEKFRKMRQFHDEHPEVGDRIAQECFLLHELLTQLHTQHREEMEAIVKMADELESECNNDGDKGTKQWMAFKGFRNTIRDKYIN